MFVAPKNREKKRCEKKEVREREVRKERGTGKRGTGFVSCSALASSIAKLELLASASFMGSNYMREGAVRPLKHEFLVTCILEGSFGHGR